MKAKEHWGNPETAKIWLDRVEKRKRTLKKSENTEITSIPFIIKEIKKSKFDSFMEVGAGNGRIIGAISKKFKGKKCYSCDINAELSKYISENYPKISVLEGSVDVSNMPIANNSFDLVYTFQVLQHVPQEEMEKALSELIRITKKELWLMEGYDNPAHYNNGQMRKGTDGGSFSWYFDRMLECYEVIEPNKDTGVRIYKIKK